MTIEEPHGPFVLCYDGSEGAQHAIRIAPTLLGKGRKAKLLFVYKPMERSLGVAQGITGGRINAPVSGETDAPKLHFEVRKNSAPVDPSSYLE